LLIFGFSYYDELKIREGSLSEQGVKSKISFENKKVVEVIEINFTAFLFVFSEAMSIQTSHVEREFCSHRRNR